MIVRADLETGTVTLLEPTDFHGFHVAVAGGAIGDPRLAAVLARHGRLDGDHAWIRVAALTALAGDAADAHWRVGLDGMVAFARDKGFLDGAGTALRAHLEPE